MFRTTTGEVLEGLYEGGRKACRVAVLPYEYGESQNQISDIDPE